MFKKPVGSCYAAASAATGFSKTLYNKAKHVVTAAELDFERFGDLPELMDKTGEVEAAWREFQRRVNPNQKHSRPKPARNPALWKHRHRQPNREAQRAVWALDGICDLLERLPVDELDLTKVEEWAAALKKHGAQITLVAKRIGNVYTKTK